MAAVEHEIVAEKASGLGRMADRLEAALAELSALGAAAAAARAEERAARVAAYNACRARAEELYFWLCVQREAIGIRNHDLVAQLYPIPPKLK